MHTASDLGRLLLRLTLGILTLLHGIGKITSGPASILGLVAQPVAAGEAIGRHD